MNHLLRAVFVCFVLASHSFAAGEAAEAWTETTWNGERAFVARSRGVEAIVSAVRARLVYFGAEHGAKNFLFETAARNDPAGGGGHRLWLGPQTDWRKNWPPPAGWDSALPESVKIEEGRLELEMADAGDGWPRLTRVYFWRDGKLHCAARMSGGTRPAQMIHIVQVPATTEVDLEAAPTTEAPRGYVQVHLGRGLVPIKQFPDPPHVTAASGKLRLKFTGKMEKFGFKPQPILARLDNATMRIERGAMSGAATSTPDEGFVTQIYLGSGRAPVIELEQLSPLFPAGNEASFEIVIMAEMAVRK